MRLFVGIKASEELQTKILNWQNENIKLLVRFIKKDNLHLTFIPPFYHSDEISSVQNLKKLKKFGSIQVVFNKIFVNYVNKVIWIECSNPPNEIFRLQENLVKLFKRKKEKRQFKVHMTMARFKENLDKKEIEKAINWKVKFSSVELFESKLGPKGANYRIIRSEGLKSGK